MDRYRAVLRQLIDTGYLYPCRCTRSDIEGAQSAPHESVQDAMVYPGTCRNRTIGDAEAWEQTGQSYAWRFRVHSGIQTWRDVFCGIQSCDVQRVLGDFVVGRSNGQPAYQLAVVVDDHDMGVTEVVRGDDLIASTYRQKLLYESLGWAMPTMVHLPLVVGPDGRRLAKRHGDTRLSMLAKLASIHGGWLGFWLIKVDFKRVFDMLAERAIVGVRVISNGAESTCLRSSRRDCIFSWVARLERVLSELTSPVAFVSPQGVPQFV